MVRSRTRADFSRPPIRAAAMSCVFLYTQVCTNNSRPTCCSSGRSEQQVRWPLKKKEEKSFAIVRLRAHGHNLPQTRTMRHRCRRRRRRPLPSALEDNTSGVCCAQNPRTGRSTPRVAHVIDPLGPSGRGWGGLIRYRPSAGADLYATSSKSDGGAFVCTVANSVCATARTVPVRRTGSRSARADLTDAVADFVADLCGRCGSYLKFASWHSLELT